MNLYFDACALNRLTDDQSQTRIHRETAAVEHALQKVVAGHARFVASTPLRLELNMNPTEWKRIDALHLLSYADDIFDPDNRTYDRAEFLETSGYGAFDALHLACAESLNATVLLTTDDRFLKLVNRGTGQPLIVVANPVDWIRKVEAP